MTKPVLNKERVLAAAKWMKLIHENASNFNLGDWRYDDPKWGVGLNADYTELHRCGSTCCFAGWLAVSPEFKAAGGHSDYGVPVFNQRRGEIAIAHYLGLPQLVADAMIFGSGSDLAYNKNNPTDVTAMDVHDILLKLAEEGYEPLLNKILAEEENCR